MYFKRFTCNAGQYFLMNCLVTITQCDLDATDELSYKPFVANPSPSQVLNLIHHFHTKVVIFSVEGMC